MASSTIEAGASDNDPTISSLLEGVIEDSQSSSSTKGITVNLVLSSSSVDTWHISKDISLTVWVRHSRKTKKHLLSELGDFADDAIEFLEKSEHAIAANLANHGINKLSQWEKCPVEKHKDILSDDMLFFFSMRVSEWRVKQWNEFLSNLVLKEVPSFSDLTYHHNFTTSSGSSPMLGEDRRISLDLLLKRLRQGSAAPSKELNPIHSLIAQSRQGKSLFLDVVCEHVRKSGQFAICISYNSRTKYAGEEKNSLLESLAWYFWARVVHAIVNAVNEQEITWGRFKSYPFLPCLTIKCVLDLINKCLPMFAGKPVLFAADEFSHVLKDLKKLDVSDSIRRTAISSITCPIYNENCTLLVSGFEVENNSFFETISTRPVENYWLLPVTSADRKYYQPLIQQLKDYYKDNDFPFLLYEWTKFSPGLLGLWLERLINCKVSKMEELRPPVLEDILFMVEKDKTFYASYWKECFDLRVTTNVLKLTCMKKYEAVGTFIQLSLTEGFLNPFFVIHPSVSSKYMKSESDLFNRIIEAFTKEWVPAAKGDALERMIACALELRQIHSSGSFPFTTIVNALCGLKKFPAAATIVTDAAYTFRKSVALEEVETFPCHNCSVGNKGDLCKRWRNATKDEVKKRQQIVVTALKSYGVIHPTAACNKGCDLVLVVDCLDCCKDKGIAILMFEAKYYGWSTKLDDKSASMKAYDALEGLLNGAMGDCKVLHVCFIMCTTGDKEIYYDMDYKPSGRKRTLKKCIADLNTMETTVSLHHVRNADHWMNLLTPVLYYGLPDADEGTDNAKPQQQRSKSY